MENVKIVEKMIAERNRLLEEHAEKQRKMKCTALKETKEILENMIRWWTFCSFLRLTKKDNIQSFKYWKK